VGRGVEKIFYGQWEGGSGILKKFLTTTRMSGKVAYLMKKFNFLLRTWIFASIKV